MDISALLQQAKSLGASDLHLVLACPPMARIKGALQPMEGYELMAAEDINQAFLQVATPEEREHFHTHLELDFAYTLPGVGRIRCNAAQQRGAISLALRLLPLKIPTIDEMELPAILKELALKPRGLFLVTGPTGSGKSTTLAAMLSYLNANSTCHIVTIEDPIEYLHTSIKCAITQRELGADTHSFAEALKHVLRQDPDVVLVGEMRDPDHPAGDADRGVPELPRLGHPGAAVELGPAGLGRGRNHGCLPVDAGLPGAAARDHHHLPQLPRRRLPRCPRSAREKDLARAGARRSGSGDALRHRRRRNDPGRGRRELHPRPGGGAVLGR